MYKIQTLNAISDVIHTQLNDQYCVSKEAENPDAILPKFSSPITPLALFLRRIQT